MYCIAKWVNLIKKHSFSQSSSRYWQKSFLVTLQNRTVTAPTNPGQPIILGIVFLYSAFLLLRTLKTAACLPQRRIKRRKRCTTNFHCVLLCKRFSGITITLSAGKFIFSYFAFSKSDKGEGDYSIPLIFLNSLRYLTKKSVLLLQCYFSPKGCVPEPLR